MDPEPEVERTTSHLAITLFLAIVFSACGNKLPQSVNNQDASDTTALKKPGANDSTGRHTKTIYLTFDDGPNKGTGNVLQVATEEQVPITMFLIGQHIKGSERQTELYGRILNSPFVEVENHSYTHAHNKFERFYRNADEVQADFGRCADSLHLLSNIVRTPGRNIWRLPGIRFTDVSKTAPVADTLQQKGLKLVGWDVEWRFDNHLRLYKTDDELLMQIKSLFEKKEMQTPDHLVLLAHDQTFSDSTNHARLRSFVQKLKATGEYNFEMISKYPALAKPVVKTDVAALK